MTPLPYMKEDKRGKYWIFYLSGGPVKLSWFKKSNKLRIEFTREVNREIYNIFLKKYNRGEVYRYGDCGFVSKGARTPQEVTSTINALVRSRVKNNNVGRM